MNIEYLYEKTKIINQGIKSQISTISSEIFNKQLLELIYEFNDFVYSTNCFSKVDKKIDFNVVIPKLGNCFLLSLCFCDLANISKIELEEINENDIDKLYLEVNKTISILTFDLDKKLLLKLISLLNNIINLSNYNIVDLNNYCTKKIDSSLKNIGK